MKGGDLVILYALKALKNAGVLDDTRIIVALTGDEEDAGALYDVSRKTLIDIAKRSDVALGFEEDAGKGTVARRGMGGWQLVVAGRQAHSSGIFSQGSSYGAIYEAARILNEFREKLSGEQYLTFNPAVIVGGTDVTYDSSRIAGTVAGKDNIIAPRVRAGRSALHFSRAGGQGARGDACDRGAASSRHFGDDNIRGRESRHAADQGNYALLASLDSVSRALRSGPGRGARSRQARSW